MEQAGRLLLLRQRRRDREVGPLFRLINGGAASAQADYGLREVKEVTLLPPAVAEEEIESAASSAIEVESLGYCEELD